MTLATVGRRAVAALPPALRWRARNAIALARWMRLRTQGERAQAAYADDFWTFHSGGDWDGLAALILRFCAPRSIVDVGCGDGKLLAALRPRVGAMRLLGVDSSKAGLGRASAAGVPVQLHDLSSTRPAVVAALRARIAEFDLAISLETAEHLPPWAGAGFARALAQARMVVFSAAQPDQGGTLHLNERPSEYWRARFEACGLRPASHDEAFRAAVAALDLPWWYAANVHVFERAA